MTSSIMRLKGRGLGRERGFTLLEALIAGVVLGVGLLAAYRFNSTTIAFSAESNVRAYALTLAEGKLEELRNFQDSPDFDAQVKDGVDGSVDYASSSLTRSWDRDEAYGDNPRKIGVTVTWKDRQNVDQSVVLSSVIWRNNPESGAEKLFLALTSDGKGVDSFGDSNGNLVEGAGEDGGTVIIADKTAYDPGEEGTSGDHPGFNPDKYWDIELFGDIYFTDDGLESVSIDKTTALAASCDIVDSVAYAPLDGGVVLDGDGNAVLIGGSTIPAIAGQPVYENGAFVIDVYGAPVTYTDSVKVPDPDTRYVAKFIGAGDSRELVYYEASLIALAEGTGGFRYRCEILGVPDSDSSWSGALTYTAAGNDAVCIPKAVENKHTVNITIFNQPPDNITTFHDELAVVVLNTKGSCPKVTN